MCPVADSYSYKDRSRIGYPVSTIHRTPSLHTYSVQCSLITLLRWLGEEPQESECVVDAVHSLPSPRNEQTLQLETMGRSFGHICGDCLE